MFWIAYLIFLPGIFVILGAHDGIGNRVFFWIGGAWLVSVVAADAYLSAFRCLRCTKRYFFKPWFNNPYARKCLHCGLRKWSSNEQISN
jgi:hypothetical protein